MALAAPVPSGAQARSPRDSATVARLLPAATGAARVPLLLEMAAIRRDDPASVVRLTDEVLTMLARHPSARDEVRARLDRAFALQTLGEYTAALAEAERAQRMSAEWASPGRAPPESDQVLAADALYHVAYVNWRLARYPEARATVTRARALLEPLGKSGTLAKTLSLIGAVHYVQSELDSALQAYLASLRMSEDIGDEIAAGRAHNNIGLVLLEFGRTAEAHEAFRRALTIHERLGPRQFLMNTLTNMGLVLIEMGRPREALSYLHRALEMDRQSGNRYGEAKEYSNIGYAHEKLNAPRLALRFHERALAVRESIGDKDGTLRSLGAIADVRMHLGEPRAAIPLFERAVTLATAINARAEATSLLGLLSSARAAAGDTAGALRDYRRFHELHAALNDSTLRRQIAELEARYQALARERELAAVSVLAESRRTKLRGLVAGSVLLAACLLLLGVMYAWRARTLRALRESEQRYRALFQSSVTPTFLVEAGTRRIVDRNGPARALGDPAAANAAAVPELEPEWLRRALQRALDSAHGRHVVVDDAWTEASGEQRWTEVHGSPVTLGGRSCLLVMVRDTTEERQRAAALHREDKLQSLGVLAGGIAHDFNNALTAILGHIALAHEGDPVERRDMLAAAERSALGAGRLTAQLLAFAKGGKPLRQVSDIGQLLRDAVTLAGAGSHMRVDFDLPADLWHASVDRGQFSQVVSNIVINAQQATGEGGRLVIRAANVRDGLPVAAVPHAATDTEADPDQARYVRIDFEDNGGGIPDSIRSRVFDPYFTTRSGGTGLGLATAFAICRNHGGALTFDSRKGGGTTFHAFFPATGEALASAPPDTTEAPDGNGSVLVLDDEPLVRDSVTRLLAHWGFEVESVADGRAAVERYLERLRAGRPFDLLIMDLTIPGGMGGRQAMAEILRHDPGARAIVASGYSDDPTMARHREAGFAAALAKPFRREDLAQAVQAVLGSGRKTQAGLPDAGARG